MPGRLALEVQPAGGCRPALTRVGGGVRRGTQLHARTGVVRGSLSVS
ncbi:MAG: hypothetical protein ACLPQY_19525 [Streptosporangiaceae bacterium]